MTLSAIIDFRGIELQQFLTIKNIWFWITILEFLFILFLIYNIKSKNSVSKLSEFESKHLKKAKNNSIDMDNLINSIHKSRDLYKLLSKKCHPDRFVNDPKQKIAEEIFQEISKNERNFQKLNSLKSRAVNELNINF